MCLQCEHNHSSHSSEYKVNIKPAVYGMVYRKIIHCANGKQVRNAGNMLDKMRYKWHKVGEL